MSPIARRFLITSLVYLLLGLVAQLITIFDVWLGFNPLAYTAIAATTQIFIFGWLTQVGLALVYDRWLESQQIKTVPSSPISRPSLSAKLVFSLFNLGFPLALLGQPGLILWGGTWLGTLAVLGGIVQLLAGLIFVGQVWSTLKKP